MPENANIIKEWKAYELALGVDWVVGDSGTQGAMLQVISADNAVTASPTVTMTLTSDGSTTDFVYDGPNAPFGGYTHSVGSGYSGFKVRVVFNDFKVYARSTYATFKTFWSSIDFYIDDVLLGSLGSGDDESLGLGPHYIRPLSGMVIVGPAPTMTGDYDLSVWGGWRFQTVDDEWHDLPISLPEVFEASTTLVDSFGLSPVEFPAPYGLHLGDYVTATTTYGDLIRLAKITSEGGDITLEGSGATLWLIPNLSREAVRVFGDDFGAEMWRSGRVGATASSARAGNQLDPGHFGTSGSTETVFAEQAAVSTDNFGDWHAPTLDDCYAFVQLGVHKQTIDGPFETLTFEFPSGVSGGSGDQYHDDPYVRLFASSTYHFGWNTGYTPREDQEIGGEVIKQNDYWQRIRELPLGLQGVRNTVYGCPLFESGHQPWQDLYRGGDPDNNLSGVRWAGVHRFDIARFDDIPASRPISFDLLDIDPEIGSLTDNGTDFTVDAGYFDFDLASYYHSPYLYWALCDRISVKWNPAEVSNVKVFVKEFEGTAWHEVTPIANDTPFKIPSGLKEHTAGSWAIENGFGVVDDLGTDSRPEAISGDALSYSNHSFDLLAGRRARKVRVTFDLIGSDATFEFPKLHLSGDDRKFFVETGQVGTVLWETSSHLRWGQLFYYLDGFMSPPVPLGLGTKNTVVDALCMENHVFRDQGSTTDVVSDLAAMYDSFEVNSVDAVDRLTISFLLPFRTGNIWEIAHVDTTREVPPLLCFPHRDRSSLSDWQPGSEWTNKSWIFTQLPRTIMSAGVAARFDGMTVPGPVFGQWRLVRYTSPVDSDPLPLKTGAIEIAQVRPWHGWICLLGSLPIGGDCHLTTDRHTGDMYGLAVGDDFATVYKFRPTGTMESLEYPVVPQRGQIAWSTEGILVTLTIEDSVAMVRVSVDRAASWADIGEIGMATEGGIAVDPLTGDWVAVTYVTDHFVCSVSADRGETWDVRGTVATIDEQRVGIEISPEGAGLWVVLFGDGSVVISPDRGSTWTAV